MAEQAQMTTIEQQSSSSLTAEERKDTGTGRAGESITTVEPYDILKGRLTLANAAERCRHGRADGAPCAAPHIKKGTMCYAHTRMLAVRPKALRLPPLEDVNGVQLAIMEVARAVIDGVIDRKMAALLFYGLRIAALNVTNATFENIKFTEVVSLETPEIQQEPPARSSSLPN